MAHMTAGEGVLREAAERYGFDAADLELVRDISHPVYVVTAAGRPSILRLSPMQKRTRPMILGELEWMAYLKGHDVGVPEVWPSRSGQVVESISDGSQTWQAVLFEKVAGVHPERELLSEGLVREWGRQLGKMHRLAQGYRPSSPELKRPDWYGLEVFQFEQRIPEQYRAENAAVLEACNRMTAYLRQMPTPPEAYGLIHADIEPANVLVDGERLIFIDFEECCYCWFGFDLAVSLTYAVLGSWQFDVMEIGNEENDRHVQKVWNLLMAGYRQENLLDDVWLAAVPVFLRLRAMEDYIHTLRELASGSEEDWLLDSLGRLRYIIESDFSFAHVRWL